MPNIRDYQIDATTPLSDAAPAAWSPNIVSGGDTTTGGVGRFWNLRNAGTIVSTMTKAGALAIAGLLAIGSASFANTAPALKANGTALEVRLADDSALTTLTAKGLALTGGTITASAPNAITQTWNSGGVTFEAATVDVTDTASAAASTLLSLKVGGAAKASFSKTGALTIAAGSAATSTPFLSISQTWNGSGQTFYGAVIDITNTASATASRIVELRVAGAAVFNIAADAYIVSNGGAALGGNQCYIRATTGQGTGAIWVPGGNTSSFFGFTTNTVASSASTISAMIYRPAAGVIGVRGTNSTSGGVLNFLEQTDPTAPGTDQVNIYAKDNGSGKTQIVAQFNTGAVQVLATQP